MKPSHSIRARVLAFYRDLAFNRHSSVKQQVRDIKKHDPVSAYPVLEALLGPGVRVLEVGCGTGWLSNSMGRHYAAEVTGIDMNPDAIEFARQVGRSLRQATEFKCADLFEFTPDRPFPVVVSMGVLHHTQDCSGAVQRVCSELLAPGGHALIGLYHRYGRRPFLRHFEEMRQAGANEQDLLRRYRELHAQIQDATHARSWFRDQVLHPHETWHTLQEMAAPVAAAGCEIVSTSINQFGSLAKGLDSIYPLEPGLEQVGQARLREGRYYPGFFLFLARKPHA